MILKKVDTKEQNGTSRGPSNIRHFHSSSQLAEARLPPREAKQYYEVFLQPNGLSKSNMRYEEDENILFSHLFEY